MALCHALWLFAIRRTYCLEAAAVSVSHTRRLAAGHSAEGLGAMSTTSGVSASGSTARSLAALSASKSRSPIAVGAQNACSCAIFDDGSIGCVGACARVGAALREALREKASLLL